MKILTDVRAEGLRVVRTKFSVNWGGKTYSTFQYNPVTLRKVVFERNFFVVVVCADPVKNMGHILLWGLSDIVQDDTWNA